MKTAEFVTPKHPDKMCDQISDAIVDFFIGKDKDARIAVEAMGGHGYVFIAGEITDKTIMTQAKTEEIIRNIIRDIVEEDVIVRFALSKQSSEISRGVDIGGAGDQGIMRGYAVDDTESLMPYEYEMARSLCKFLYERHPYDGKVQVTTDDEMNIKTVVVSFQHVLKHDLRRAVIKWLLGNKIDSNALLLNINPAGDWTIGGFDADTGLTGRKLVVDNYGPRFAIGGGAFSGKDPTKVDRSAAYMARRVAIDVLREHKAKEVMVELAYAIGVPEPVDSSVIMDGKKYCINKGRYDLTPRGIIDELKLKEQKYEETAKWGHFGNGFIWG